MPADPPELELKATYGLVSPNDITLSNISPLWTPVSYAAFTGPKADPKDKANSVSIFLSYNTTHERFTNSCFMCLCTRHLLHVGCQISCSEIFRSIARDPEKC